jgi:arsenite methyltransferase
VRSSMELWVGCVAGALTEQEFHSLLWESGFQEIGIEPTRLYEFEDARAFLSGAGLDTEVLAREVGGRVMGAFIRARKPVIIPEPVATNADETESRPCCGSSCCA